MPIGLDCYSFHRLLGEIRPGEEDAGARLRDGGAAVTAEARRLPLDGISLETCLLEPPGCLDLEGLPAAAGPVEIVLSWGAPNRLELGAEPAALADEGELVRRALDWLRKRDAPAEANVEPAEGLR
jgi:hypothetical protein